MKISVIIPTYNDEDYIIDTLKSIETQSYKDYEVIIVDDGSSDNTKIIVSDFINKKDKYTYIYQDNQDQLKAIITGSKKVTGDIVFILHSDDILYNDDVFKEAVNTFKNNNIDALIGDLSIVDKDLKPLGVQKTNTFKQGLKSSMETYLYLGRNMYCDTAFFTKEVFFKNVMDNYLIWNMPFWLNKDGTTLKVQTTNNIFIKYRQSDSNYILSDLGKLNVLNGELRVINFLSDICTIPCYSFQFNVYRILKKLGLRYKPFFIRKKTNNKYKVFKYVIRKRCSKKEIDGNVYLSSLLSFYRNKNNRTIKIDVSTTYFGNEIKDFNKKLVSNSLDKDYYDLFNEMKKGFNKIITNNKEDMEKTMVFLNISDVEIEVEK